MIERTEYERNRLLNIGEVKRALEVWKGLTEFQREGRDLEILGKVTAWWGQVVDVNKDAEVVFWNTEFSIYILLVGVHLNIVPDINKGDKLEGTGRLIDINENTEGLFVRIQVSDPKAPFRLRRN